MKIAINKRIVKGPWGGGNQILMMLVDYFHSKNIEVIYGPSHNIDAVLMMDVRDGSCSFPLSDIKKLNAKVIHRINDTGSHRQNDNHRTELMLSANQMADSTIFISEWVKSYYSERGFQGKYTVIDNAADRSLFKPLQRLRKPIEPLRLVTHHWSDNISKGYDIYKNIDTFCGMNPDMASFRFIGRECCSNNFSERCDKIGAQAYKDLPPYLNSQDIYITASLFEAGGCHIVEGMACGLIPLVRIGGGGTESYSSGFNVLFESSSDLIRHLHELYEDYNLYRSMKSKIEEEYVYTSQDMCQKYLDVIMEGL